MSNIKAIMDQAAAANSPGWLWSAEYANYALTGYEWQGRGSYVTGSSLNSTSVPVQYTPLFLKPDGTKVWVGGRSSQRIYEYDLSTPYYMAGLNNPTQTYTSIPSNHQWYDIHFSPDGTKFFSCNKTAAEVRAWNLSTAWDLSTASYVGGQTFSGSDPWGISFKTDGTKMYLCNYGGSTIREYDLSTAWDLSTATLNQNAPPIAIASPIGLTFKSDGTYLVVITQQRNASFYSLSTPWDLSTITNVGTINMRTAISATSTDEYYGITINDEGSLCYGIHYNPSSATNNIIRQFNVGTLFTVNQNTTGIEWSTDGDYFYYVQPANDYVYGYSASTPYDLTTLQYQGLFGFTTQEATVEDVTFKTDGTVMYIVGSGGDEVNSFTLSTPWDITTAVYASTFSVSAQTNAPKGITFSSDGTKMHISQSQTNTILEYNLGTAWDITSALYNQASTFTVSGTQQHRFAPDGKKLFAVSSTSVNQYELSTAWDISTATLIATADDEIKLYAGSPTGLALNPNGREFYVQYWNGVKRYTFQPQ